MEDMLIFLAGVGDLEGFVISEKYILRIRSKINTGGQRKRDEVADFPVEKSLVTEDFDFGSYHFRPSVRFDLIKIIVGYTKENQ